MTTRQFLIVSYLVSASMLAIAIWVAFQHQWLGIAVAAGACMLAVWATASYRRKLWAWRAARTLSWLLFGLSVVALVAIPAPHYFAYGTRDPVFLASAAAAFIVFIGCAVGFWRAIRYLREARGSFDAANELERRLGKLPGEWRMVKEAAARDS